MATQKFTLPNTSTAIWAEPDNINYYLNTPLDPDVAAGVENKTSTVKTHTRRQYPGDTTPINVSSFTRNYMVDPGAKFSRGLPGQPFRVVSGAGTDTEENRQFTFQGDWMDVHALFVGSAKMEVQLYSGRGRYTVPAATPPA